LEKTASELNKAATADLEKTAADMKKAVAADPGRTKGNWKIANVHTVPGSIPMRMVLQRHLRNWNRKVK